MSGKGIGSIINEAAESGVCPTCGATSADRVGGKPSKPEESGNRGGDIHPDHGAGLEHGSGPDEDVKWFHYIPVNEYKEWEKIG